MIGAPAPNVFAHADLAPPDGSPWATGRSPLKPACRATCTHGRSQRRPRLRSARTAHRRRDAWRTAEPAFSIAAVHHGMHNRPDRPCQRPSTSQTSNPRTSGNATAASDPVDTERHRSHPRRCQPARLDPSGGPITCAVVSYGTGVVSPPWFAYEAGGRSVIPGRYRR